MLTNWAILIVAMLTPPADGPRMVRVALDVVDVLADPDDAAFSTGRLVRGRRLLVRREGPDGWLTIAPPEGAFSLIEEAALEDLGDGRARVIARLASVRPGREGARMPGPPHVSLKRGTIVRLLDRRPLVVRTHRESRSWIAIAPPRTEVRFVRADAVTDEPIGSEEPESTRRARGISTREDADPFRDDHPRSPKPSPPELGPIDVALVSSRPDQPETGLSREVAEEVARIATAHRAILRRTIDRWDLAAIEEAYAKLLRSGLEPPERRAVEDRLALVRRQKAAATAAAKLDALLRASRARDGRVAEARQDLSAIAEDGSRDYDAAGLLQTSSRMVEGRRVHALLGDDGAVVAYLTIPPGLVVRPLLSHRVGVRGEGHYDESLRTRLILVRDMERLERRNPARARDEGRSSQPR